MPSSLDKTPWLEEPSEVSCLNAVEKLLPFIKGNVGFIFTNGDLKSIRDIVVSNVVAAPARAGAVAPKDVWIPAGNTGMEPGKTSFFQALGVPRLPEVPLKLFPMLRLLNKMLKLVLPKLPC